MLEAQSSKLKAKGVKGERQKVKGNRLGVWNFALRATTPHAGFKVNRFGLWSNMNH